ncbi:gluconate:H+ symporter [Puia sp.]|jgi:Gnt-I system high-affinity gluconate transporter|uniref:gluconate:H+ symporter n=1 Tax=Puia sp. TaxID=2045100 RepID=UPI002F3F7A2D
MPLLLSFAGIVCLVLLITWCRLDTFISFVVVSVAIGLASGLDIHRITDAIQKGIGSIMGSLVIILGFGAMLGKLIADSGAAQQITESLVRISGIRRIQWAMALSGFLVGIPMFYSAGFMVLLPLIFSVAAVTGLPLLYLGIPMLAALSVAHGFLPPHPSPTAIAGQLHAGIGKTLFYGLIVAVPTIILAGIVFGRTMRKYKPATPPTLLTMKFLEPGELPSLGISLAMALLPLILLTATTVFRFIPVVPPLQKVIAFIGDPNIAMLLSVLAALYWLGIKRHRPVREVMRSLEDAFKGVAPFMLIIAGAGAFMQVMSEGGLNQYIAKSLEHSSIPPLVLGWSIAALIRICTGSSTVAALTTVGTLLPVLQQSSVEPELMVLAVGAGSMTFSHVNDGGFWLFKEYFNLTIRQTFATWTVMETMVSVVGLLMVLLLNQIVH